ncbi:MAG: helix-turn-helix transcriptional regulator [Saprospiraceae bacterium]|nr:helix-turn-helix transcriptional regulator [Saprospiraceae bacterium]
MTVGQRIKHFREGKKLSVTDFAQLVKVSERNVYNYEADKTSPHTSFWESLFTVFEELNPKWMLTGKGNISFEDDLGEVQEPATAYLRREELTDLVRLIDRVKDLTRKVDQLELEVKMLKEE